MALARSSTVLVLVVALLGAASAEVSEPAAGGHSVCGSPLSYKTIVLPLFAHVCRQDFSAAQSAVRAQGALLRDRP